MSDTTTVSEETHAAHAEEAAHAATHDAGAHADPAHGDRAHGEALGPIDWYAWGAGLLGIGAGLAVAICLYLSTTL